jgi:hypothetical protein
MANRKRCAATQDLKITIQEEAVCSKYFIPRPA